MAAAVFTLAATGAASCVTAGEPLSDDATPPSFAGEPLSDDAIPPAPAGEPSVDDYHPESTVSEHQQYREGLLSPTLDVLAQLPGFQVGGLESDVDELVVYWKGEFGPEAQAAVEEANRRGIEVNVIPVPYSYDELRRIAGPLIEALAAKGIETEGYTIGDPFNEIAMWGSALDKSAELRRLAEDTAADVLPPDLKLVIVPSPGEAIPADSRHADGDNQRPAADS